jgi:hypothetical protein
MVTFKNFVAQGDIYVRRVSSVPSEAVKVDEKGPIVVAHSETVHHHLFKDPTGVSYFTTPDPFVCYLRMETSALLEHNREFDTHESILFPPGSYEIRRQREATPEGFRRVED